MNAGLIGSLADSAVMVCAGVYFTFARHGLVQKFTDPQKKARAEQTFRVVGPLLLVCGLLLGGAKVLNAEDDLAKIARSINAACPKTVDAITRMDGAASGPGRRLTISVTVTSLNAAEIDRASWTNSVVPTIRQNSAKTEFSKLVASGVTLVYRYSGKDGVFFDEVVISPPSSQK